MSKNKFKNNRKLTIIMALIAFVLVGITLGQALLSSTLTITGRSTIAKNSWTIYFDDIDIEPKSTQNQNENDNPKISINGVADPKKQNIEFTANLKKPGDYYEFTVDTVNDGTIDAHVETVEKSVLTAEQEKYLEFYVTYDDGTEIKPCDILPSKTSMEEDVTGTIKNKRKIKATVIYKKNAEVTDYPSNGVTVTLSFKINYVQEMYDCTPSNEKYHRLTIRPNGGEYEGRMLSTVKSLKEDAEEPYILTKPIREMYEFIGWEVIIPEENGTYQLEQNEHGTYDFYMGKEDVVVEAKWKDGEYVARIEDHYYTTIQAAFDAVDGAWTYNTVYLLRDTEEYAVNNAINSFIFDLDGHTVTGKITNNKNITLIDGTIVGVGEGEAVLNKGTLTLGIDDGVVEVDNSITLKAEKYGLVNETRSKFNFYDGYVESENALTGMSIKITSSDVKLAENHFVFVDRTESEGKIYQKVYLTPTPNRAVVKTSITFDAYHYDVREAITAIKDAEKLAENNSDITITDKERTMTVIRTFEAAYPIVIDNDSKIFFDLKGYSVQIGEPITNNGEFKIYNSKNTNSLINLSKTITNNGKLEIASVNLKTTTDYDAILNKGDLKLSNLTIDTKSAYCVKNVDNGTLDFNENVVLKSNHSGSTESDTYALYNSGNKATINGGTIYGLQNTGTITIDGESAKFVLYKKYTGTNYVEYIPAIYNTGNITMNNGTIENGTHNTPMIRNIGTFTFNGGTISSEYTCVDNNSGTFNVKGSEISSTRTTITEGIVNVDGGIVRSTTTNALSGNSQTVNVKSGEVIAENGVAINSNTANITGGTVIGTTTAINSTNVNVSSGLVQGNTAINSTNLTISGGNLEGTSNGAVTSNLTMSGGNVSSSDEIGIVISGTGNITGGKVLGATYGVYSKNTLTLGRDDGTISNESPVLEGELYGLYIEGSTTNFYDGILKGQTDGYTGNITGTPLGSVVFEGVEDRGEEGFYQTDYVSIFDPWLRIGNATYNTLNAASEACEDTCKMYVIRDADITFAQNIFGENKNITLDLNGHVVTTTQSITNYSSLTIEDTQVEEDAGVGPGTLKILKNSGITNEKLIIINGGRFEGLTDQVITNNGKTSTNGKITAGLIINKATFNVSGTTFLNKGLAEINGMIVERSSVGIRNGIVINGCYGTVISGTLTINGTRNTETGKFSTIINASGDGITNQGSVTFNGGKLKAGSSAVREQCSGSITVNEIKKVNLDNDEEEAKTEVISVSDHALINSYVTINSGLVKSENNIGIYSYSTTINGGYIVGTEGLENTCRTHYLACVYGPVNMTGGTVEGTVSNGMLLRGNVDAFEGAETVKQITGGEVIGKTNGVKNNGTLILGNKGGSLLINQPILRGIDEYGLRNEGYFKFYDGILKGKKKEGITLASHTGMLQEIEDATMVKQDYEYINGVYYQTEYLSSQGNWLEIDDGSKYNTIDRACAAVENNGKIKVIASTHIAFVQNCEEGKNITFDLNGYSVSLTQPIYFRSNMRFIDSVGDGLLNNQRTTLIYNSGNSTVEGGTYSSTGGVAFSNSGNTSIIGGTFTSPSNYAITNSGTLNYSVASATSNSSNAISNSGTLVFNGGEVKSNSTYAINNSGNFTMNNGEIVSYGGVYNSGTFRLENGNIEGTNIYSLENSGSAIISGGELISDNSNGVQINTSSNLTLKNDAKITSLTSNGISITGCYNSCSTPVLNIEGGTVTGKTNGITTGSDSITINISGGHIIGQNTYGMNILNNGSQYRYGQTKITGGVIEGAIYGVYTKLSDYDTYYTQIGENDGVIVSIDTPVLIGNSYGLFIDGGTLNFYDGVLKGRLHGYYGEMTNIAPATMKFEEDSEMIDELEYNLVYLLKESVIAKNINKPNGELSYTEYSNLQTAFDEASDGDTIELITNVPMYYPATNNKKITLDMAGYTISTNKKITNTNELNIINSGSNEAIIKTSANMNLITNTGKLSIENVTLKNISASQYVIQNSNELLLNNMKIDSRYGVNSSRKLTIEDSEIKTISTAINNTGSLTINEGTYIGSTSVYSDSSSNVSINNAILNGIYYNSGNNTATLTDSTLNGELQNRTSNLTVSNSSINDSVSNTGRLKITENSKITGTYYDVISNSGTAEIDNATIKLSSNRNTSYYEYAGIQNSGTMTVSTTTIEQDNYADAAGYAIAVRNSGLFTMNDSEIRIGSDARNASTYIGIYTNGSGNTNITDSEIYVKGASTCEGIYSTDRGTTILEDTNMIVEATNTGYGVYSASSNAKVVFKTGGMTVSKASTTYGAYINVGTFELGVYDGNLTSQEQMSHDTPVMHSIGTRGTGVKKINGTFNFYDGTIYASKYSKPETTSNVEKYFEVTTYVDSDTGYEYCWLEFMGDDYIGSDAIALIERGLNTIYLPTLERALEDVQDGEVIKILKSTAEDMTIPSGKNVIIDLNNHSITSHIDNSGTLQVYNGSVQNFDDIAIENYGTLILGQNDGTVSSTNIRVISEVMAIKNRGTLKMYDGYLEGNPSIEGKIDEIAESSRIYTVSDSQSEKKYLQSLDPESILNRETALIITIDPVRGYYEGSPTVKQISKFYGDEIEIPNPTKNGCTFEGWDVDVEGVLNGTTLTVGTSDITLTAIWSVSDDAVAKIGYDYYTSVANAIMEAEEGDKVEIIKNHSEDVTNDKNITLDLGGYTLTGAFINTGILRLVNGTIDNPDGVGLLNKKTLTLGENDGSIEMEDIVIKGSTIGIDQQGGLNFYDGYIEAPIALTGDVNSVPKGYFLYIEQTIEGLQREYLIGNPQNAVAIIKNSNTDEEGTVQYFFSLQDAINTASITGREIYIVKDFIASYIVEVREEANIVINMSGYDIQLGNTVTNNGNLKIYDTSENKGTITLAKPITNNGELLIEDIEISQNKEENTINNNGDLKLRNAKITATTKYAISNTGTYEADDTTEVLANSYSFYNNSNEPLTLTQATYSGIINNKEMIIEDGVKIRNNSGACLYSSTDGSKTTINDIDCTSTNVGISLQGNNQTLTLTSGTITSTNAAIYTSSGSGTINVSDVTISGGRGLEIRSTHNVTATNNEITTSGYPIFMRTTSGQLTLNNNTIKSTGNSVIYTECENSNYKNNITINEGTYTGVDYGAYLVCTNFTMNGGELTTTSTNSGRYGIYETSSSYVSLNSGSKVNAPSASGVYLDNGLSISISNSEIYAGANNGYGIYQYNSTTTMNGNSKITAPGSSSYGIYIRPYASGTSRVTMNNGEITSGNIGIYVSEQTWSYNPTVILDINKGSIKGNTYGTYQAYWNSTINVGRTSDELSIEIPYITGGAYGVYKTSGTSNFYSGRVRGYTKGYNSDFLNVRSGKEIVEVSESAGTENIKTYSTTSVSETPISNTPKQGNGYAKITYVGEDDGTCTNGQEWNFSYTGVEDTFSVPCSGTYKLEVWGASGGTINGTYVGGYGGYSTGEIELEENNILFINVGGAGNKCSGNNCTVAGGYNGGGSARTTTICGSGASVGSGGGATHIATSTGLLKDLENNRSSVLIVAGGGGGANYCNGSNYASGGSGGGYIAGSSINKGAPDWSRNGGPNATGGTQESGYAFGYAQNAGESDHIGAGAGWYSGKASSINGAGGGSGYIGSSRLTNKYMYGYSVSTTINSWIVNYLVNKEDFLQVGENTYNIFADAIADAKESRNSILLIRDVKLQETVTFESGNEFTFDLNGHELYLTKRLYVNGILNLIDSQDSGLMNVKGDYALQNSGTLRMTGIKINSNSGGLYLNSSGTTIITDSEITTSGYPIFMRTTSGQLTLNNNTIKSTGNSVIYTECENSNYKNNITINEGTYTGVDYGAYLVCTNFTMNGGELKTTSTNSGRYGIYETSSSYVSLNSGSKVNAPSASGVYLDNGLSISISNSEIYAGANNGYGIYQYNSTTTMNGNSKITTPGSSSYGIYIRPYASGTSRVTMNNGEITSGNIGIYVSEQTWSYNPTVILDINKGSIKGNTYGTYQAYWNSTINVGRTSDELSLEIPYISGGTYGIYKTSGTFNFYSGRLRGKTNGYNSEFLNLRSGMDIYTEYEGAEDEHTFSTNNTSETPVSRYAKKGNGYAKLTYLGSSNNVCENKEEFTFDYAGSEQTFEVLCTGEYKLEVWGAQGGSHDDINHGGYGGYSTGIIELSEGETLYINVGGAGTDAIYGNAGGYNGGGSRSDVISSDSYLGSGGGATHIATSTGLLKDLENNKDSILIVAGGGGGSYYYNSDYYGIGGSGGGYNGGTSYIYRNGDTYTSTPATQESGYAFGEGQIGGIYHSGGGGGYYGGLVVENASGGGSGYIGNSRLLNASMYGYQLSTTYEWANNYLERKDPYLRVGENLYNVFADAIADAKESGNTIVLLRDSKIQETVPFSSGSELTFDLNGHKLSLTKRLYVEGTLNLIDSQNSGLINVIGDYALQNSGTLRMTGIKINSNSGGLYLNSSGTTVITDSEITASGYPILMRTTNGQLTLNNNTIKSTGSSVIYTECENSNYRNYITINDGTYTGADYGAYLVCTNFTMNGGELKTTSTNNGRYGIYETSSSYVSLNSGSKVNAPSASGVYLDNGLSISISNSEIYAGANNGYGIYQYNSTTTMNGNSKITAPGSSSYGIYIRPYASGTSRVTMNNGEMISGNVGIYVSEQTWSYNPTVILDINKGSITANTYAIQQAYWNSTINVGNTNDYVSINDPYIYGKLYGIYEQSGSMNFYNGRIRGKTGAYTGTFNNIRTGYEIYEDEYEITLEEQKERTFTTTNVSDVATADAAKKGNGYARITYTGDLTVKSELSYEEYSLNQDINCEEILNVTKTYSYTGGYQEFDPICEGTYKIELWGAQGGAVDNTAGGKGSYTSGEIKLDKDQKLYVYVGENYNGYKDAMSYNGGGKGNYSSHSDKNGNGGGATDIRLVNGSWNNFESLKSRIMVAAGGGGASNYGGRSQGGYGGKLVGGSGNNYMYSGGQMIIVASGGEQTIGGLYAGLDPRHGTSTLEGRFGYGGYSTTYYGDYVYNSGGGGGYYGGGAGGAVSSNVGSAAGGSSFISGYEGCDAISEESTQDNIVHTGQSIHYSGLTFNNPVMYAGNENMPSHDGKSTITGHTGSGYAKITFISIAEDSTYNVKFITEQGSVNTTSKVYTYKEELGTLEIPTYSRDDIEFEGWYLEPTYKTRVDETYKVNKNLTLYARFIYKAALVSGENLLPTRFTEEDILHEEKLFEFDYTGNEQQFIVPKDGMYKVEVWGASGGSYSETYPAGPGGYSEGILNLNKDEILYINVGGQGKYGLANTDANYGDGGYNGGGSRAGWTCPNCQYYSGGGGGATHIATQSGLLKTLSSNLESILIVAGGGGGNGSVDSGWNINSTATASGGGFKGNRGNSDDVHGGIAGTQTSGYFGKGGDCGEKGVCDGGGAGFYGGEHGTNGAGGGSGYIGNTKLSEAVMYCYNCEESDDTLTKTISTTNVSSTPTSMYAKKGNGYVKITYLEPEQEEYTFNYTGAEKTFTAPRTGNYKIELWGAQGGTVDGVQGGKGAYTSGEIRLNQNQNLYIYIGENYNGYKNEMSFNGGGKGNYSTSGGDHNGNGGGATDIRLVNGNWNDFDSLKSRIMVAAGGGGAGNWSSINVGGYGGALVGGPGANNKHSGGENIVVASGGTQTIGGLYAGLAPTHGTSTMEGRFGYGGYQEVYVSDWIYNAGGGGGYYGGGSGGSVKWNVSSAAGGSSFISGYEGCDAIEEESTQDNIIHTGQSIHYSGLKFNNPVMIAGNSTMPSHDGKSTITGHTGNGYAKITYFGGSDKAILELKYDYGTLENNILEYTIGSKVGELPTPSFDNNIVFKGWYLEPTYETRVDEDYVIKGDTRVFAKLIYSNEGCDLIPGEVVSFDYTGGEQVFNASCTGKYKLEVWGAQGGTANGYRGGYGSYSTGEIELEKAEMLYINVGGEGTGKINELAIGGYNGGGTPQGEVPGNRYVASGGGATSIALKSGLLKNLSNDKDKILIVAGGGGGGYAHTSSGYYGVGGDAGGYVGNNGQANNGNYYGLGGKQDSPSCSSNNATNTCSSFGQGGSTGPETHGSAGGGGWYGGGGSAATSGSANSSGGGGSGYIGNERLFNKYMYGYNVSTRNAIKLVKSVYLILENSFIRNVTQEQDYSNLQTAFTEANDGDVLKLMSNSNVSYTVTVPAKEVTLDLNGYNLVTTKQMNNNGTLTITNTKALSTPKFSTTIAGLLINNTGTLNIDIDMSGKGLFKNSTSGVINITNSKLNASSSLLDNAGEVTINNVIATGTSSISSSGTLTITDTSINGSIVNSGTASLENVTLTSGGTTIENKNEIAISNSNITGSSYALYNSSTKAITVTNTKLTSGSYSIYNYSSGTVNLNDTNMSGTIYNNNSSGTININKVNNERVSISSKIVNKGRMNISNANISYTSNVYNTENYIENSGILTLTNNNINFVNQYSGNYEKRAIYNSGTLTTNNNIIKFNENTGNSSKYSYLFGIYNNQILTSNGDNFEIYNSKRGYGIYTNTGHDVEVNSATMKLYNITEYDYGIVSVNSYTTVNGIDIETYNNRESKGLYADSNTHLTLKNVNVNLHDNTWSSGLYVNNGVLTIESGTVLSKGTTAYGMKMTNGTYIQGIEDGRGTDAADVSITDPNIRAEGTTGIGVSMGNGTMEYYDGHIYGSTSAFASGDIVSITEKNYQTLFSDENRSCILEFTR